MLNNKGKNIEEVQYLSKQQSCSCIRKHLIPDQAAIMYLTTDKIKDLYRTENWSELNE